MSCPKALECQRNASWSERRGRDSDSGLRAERPSLLSLGDDQCRFAVLETDDPLAGYIDKLDEWFVGKQQSG